MTTPQAQVTIFWGGRQGNVWLQHKEYSPRDVCGVWRKSMLSQVVSLHE